MKKIILFNMITLDGYFEGPEREINWHNVDQMFNDFALEQLNSASLLIFGRATYNLMAGYWTSSEALVNDPVIAGKMNSLPKLVFSHTLTRAEWNNTKIARGNVTDTVKKLKREADKDIYILGSANLASSFIRNNLIDEYRIMVNPIVLGRGNSMFQRISERISLNLTGTRTFNSGNVLLIYEPAQVKNIP